jgi:hypothetical protein
MSAKKIDVEICQEILNQVPTELQETTQLLDMLDKLETEYEINAILIYTNYIDNFYSNSYYYYIVNDKYILYLYFKNAKIAYAEIRNKDTERKICAKKLDDLKN